jgi:hypothetical protein
MSEDSQPIAHHLGRLPAWGQDDLPPALPFSPGNLLRTIGPGAILLAGSIGGGEWLVGPAIAVKYGTSILWFASVAIVLQVIFNLEGIRYTLYTGEPILVGIMRLRPGSTVWASVYVLLSLAQLGVPALAAGCASVLFASFAGRLAGPGDAVSLHYLTYGVILLVVGVLLSGKTIERMLEYVSWVMIVLIFSFLVAVNILFVPLAHWRHTLVGFVHFGALPDNVDLLLLGTFAATAGAGGLGNLVISNWVRDKGFGMGARVGAITSAFSTSTVRLSPVGIIFPINAENLQRWRAWWNYVRVDQVFLWGGGCFVGMFLNVNLATAVIPQGKELDHLAAGAFQAQYMASQLWVGFWFLALLNGFWILVSTHLNNTDTLVRTVTDVLWVASPRLHQSRRMTVSRLYYGVLVVFTVFGLVAVNWGHAMTLFKVLGFVAGLMMTLSAIQILLVNLTLLPAELRPRLWRRLALVLCAGFYGVLTALQVWSLVLDRIR